MDTKLPEYEARLGRFKRELIKSGYQPEVRASDLCLHCLLAGRWVHAFGALQTCLVPDARLAWFLKLLTVQYYVFSGGADFPCGKRLADSQLLLLPS